MAKKGGGGNGSAGDSPVGGMFDFNRDGKVDFGEQWLAFKIFEECTGEEKSRHDYSSAWIHHSVLNDDAPDTSWREFCEDGSDVFIDSEDYETEDEYNEALQEARSAWRDTCEDGSEYGLYPENYETEDEYEEALEEAQEIEYADVTTPSILLRSSVRSPATDKLEKIKQENYPNKRRFNAAYTLSNEFP